MQPFEQELQRLQDEVLALGNMVERAIVESVDILKQRDLADSLHLIVLDQQISKKRFAIEMECLKFIVTQQLLEDDLRTITSILQIAVELERMADYARDIARIPFMIIEESLQNLSADIHLMATETQDMLRQALEAFMQRNLALARSIPARYDKVEALYSQTYLNLLTFMSIKSPAMTSQARYLSRLARNLERAAKRMTSIGAWIVFAITGTTAIIQGNKPQTILSFNNNI